MCGTTTMFPSRNWYDGAIAPTHSSSAGTTIAIVPTPLKRLRRRRHEPGRLHDQVDQRLHRRGVLRVERERAAHLAQRLLPLAVLLVRRLCERARGRLLRRLRVPRGQLAPQRQVTIAVEEPL